MKKLLNKFKCIKPALNAAIVAVCNCLFEKMNRLLVEVLESLVKFVAAKNKQEKTLVKKQLEKQNEEL